MANPKLAFFRGDGDARVAVYPHLKKQRPASPKHNPEEAVRLQEYNDFITRYKYPVELIDIEYPVVIREDEQPRFADIVVFTDEGHKRPFIVVEAKKPNREDGLKQGQRYATILRAVYVVWSNGGARSAAVIVNRYPEDAETISDIPDYLGSPKYEIQKLEPFEDDKQVTDSFKYCHNLIRNLSNLKPDDAFTEFLKLLLVKFQDETRGKDFEFQILLKGEPPAAESPNETAQRIRLLFKIAVDEDADVAVAFDKGDDIALTNDCIAQIVRRLQRFSFVDTSIDQKGRAFESFLSGDMRQEFKEFMTPRPVVEAIVAMAQPDRTTTILDPCCGSGAFLIYALALVRKRIEAQGHAARQQIKLTFDYAHDKLWGFDTSKQMTAVARINMLVNEDGRAHIHKFDSLNPRTSAPDAAKGKLFQLVLTNPPFGKRIQAPSSLLDHFELSKDDKGHVKKTSFLTEVLFLERNLTWLAPGGRMFIVLPDSVLGNSMLADSRRFIERQARLVASISLSPDTFGPSGAKSKTSVVVLEKRRDALEDDEADQEYPVFVAHVANVGYDFTGRSTGKNDLPKLVEDYIAFTEQRDLQHPFCRVLNRSALGSDWLAQPHIETKARSKTSGRTLKEFCSDIFTGKTAARKEYTDAGYHMVKVGNLTGRGIEFNAVERQYVSAAFAKKYEWAALKKNDILLTAAAHGPKWIGLKVDIFEGAPSHIDPKVLVCGEIMVVRPLKEGVDPYALLLYLRSPAGYNAIQHCIRGQSGHIYPDDVEAIEVPNFSRCSADKLAAGVKQLKASLAAKRLVAAASYKAEEIGKDLFPSSRQKPIIAL